MNPTKASIKFLGLFLGSMAISIGTLPQLSHASTVPAKSMQLIALNSGSTCSFSGKWAYEGTGGPVIRQSRDRITINMTRYRRPNATGRVVNSSTIEVNFPDDGTFTGRLDGQGNLNWNNGTSWQSTGSTNFAGGWDYLGRLGPSVNSVAQRDGTNKLKIDMRRYSRPMATGTATGAIATVNFPDDGTFTGTLVTPSCIQWSNNTTWTKY